MASLPHTVSPMFLNDTRFTSDGISMLLHLLTHLNPLYSEKLLLAISEITCLEIGLGVTSINYMSRVRGVSQRLRGFLMEKIIPLFAIVSLDHDRYPGVNSRYLVGYPALVNYNLLGISSLLSTEENRHQSLGLPSSTPSATTNRASNNQTQPPPTGRLLPCPSLSTTMPSHVDYSPPRGVPWNFISTIVHFNRSCPVCHFNIPDDSPHLKFHWEAGCPALEKHGYVC